LGIKKYDFYPIDVYLYLDSLGEDISKINDGRLSKEGF